LRCAAPANATANASDKVRAYFASLAHGGGRAVLPQAGEMCWKGAKNSWDKTSLDEVRNSYSTRAIESGFGIFHASSNNLCLEHKRAAADAKTKFHLELWRDPCYASDGGGYHGHSHVGWSNKGMAAPLVWSGPRMLEPPLSPAAGMAPNTPPPQQFSDVEKETEGSAIGYAFVAFFEKVLDSGNKKGKLYNTMTTVF
jgi:hypothetical protein